MQVAELDATTDPIGPLHPPPVSIVQNPTTSLADDVAATRLTIARTQGPVVLVGHSYGGVVVTEAGTDPKVAGLVYITAFAPDKGESAASLIANPPPGAPVPPILPPGERLSVSRQCQLSRFVRSRRQRRQGRVHGRLAGAVGRWRALRFGHRTRLEDQAELGSGRDRRQDDAACSAPNGSPRRRDGCGSCRQPRDLRFQAGGRGGAHSQGSKERER